MHLKGCSVYQRRVWRAAQTLGRVSAQARPGPLHHPRSPPRGPHHPSAPQETDRPPPGPLGYLRPQRRRCSGRGGPGERFRAARPPDVTERAGQGRAGGGAGPGGGGSGRWSAGSDRAVGSRLTVPLPWPGAWSGLLRVCEERSWLPERCQSLPLGTSARG